MTWRPASIATPIAAEPLTVDEVKARLRIDAEEEDATLTAMIKESRDYAERYCGIRIAPIGLALQCSAFADLAVIPEAPLQSVTSIAYLDADGAPQTVPDTVFQRIGEGLDARIVLKPGQSWPAIQSGTWITLTAAFGFEPVPPAMQRAMLRHIADAYDVREDKPAAEFTAVDALLCNFRRY